MLNGLGEVVLEMMLKIIAFGLVTFLIGVGVGWIIWV